MIKSLRLHDKPFSELRDMSIRELYVDLIFHVEGDDGHPIHDRRTFMSEQAMALTPSDILSMFNIKEIPVEFERNRSSGANNIPFNFPANLLTRSGVPSGISNSNGTRGLLWFIVKDTVLRLGLPAVSNISKFVRAMSRDFQLIPAIIPELHDDLKQAPDVLGQYTLKSLWTFARLMLRHLDTLPDGDARDEWLIRIQYAAAAMCIVTGDYFMTAAFITKDISFLDKASLELFQVDADGNPEMSPIGKLASSCLSSELKSVGAMARMSYFSRVEIKERLRDFLCNLSKSRLFQESLERRSDSDSIESVLVKLYPKTGPLTHFPKEISDKFEAWCATGSDDIERMVEIYHKANVDDRESMVEALISDSSYKDTVKAPPLEPAFELDVRYGKVTASIKGALESAGSAKDWSKIAELSLEAEECIALLDLDMRAPLPTFVHIFDSYINPEMLAHIQRIRELEVTVSDLTAALGKSISKGPHADDGALDELAVTAERLARTTKDNFNLNAKVEQLTLALEQQANKTHKELHDVTSLILAGKLTFSDIYLYLESKYSNIRWADNKAQIEACNFAQPERILEALIKLMDEYLPHVMAGDVDSLNNGYSVWGESFSPRESVETMALYEKTRSFKFDGECEVITKHITLGRRHGDRFTAQIYFTVDRETGVVSIGYIGGHLPIYSIK